MKKETFDEIKKSLIDNIRKKDADSFNVLLKSFFDDEELLGNFLFLLVDVDRPLCSAILSTFMACGKRIQELEQTISTYETALQSERRKHDH